MAQQTTTIEGHLTTLVSEAQLENYVEEARQPIGFLADLAAGEDLQAYAEILGVSEIQLMLFTVFVHKVQSDPVTSDTVSSLCHMMIDFITLETGDDDMAELSSFEMACLGYMVHQLETTLSATTPHHTYSEENTYSTAVN